MSGSSRIFAAWLVEAKQSVIENMAPVLTLIFTPLFTLLLLAFLGTMAWTGSGIAVGREVLIGFDLLLVVVAGLVLYAISARDLQKPPGLFDALQLLLVLLRCRCPLRYPNDMAALSRTPRAPREGRRDSCRTRVPSRQRYKCVFVAPCAEKMLRPVPVSRYIGG